MKNYFELVKKDIPKILLAALLNMAATFCALILPSYMKDIIDKGINMLDVDVIIKSGIVMLAIAGAAFFISIGARILEGSVIVKFCAKLRAKIFNKTQRLSLEQFEKIGTGALVTRSTHDIHMIAWLLTTIMSTAFTMPIMFFGGVALSFSFDVVLSLIFFAFAPILIAIVLLLGKKIVPRYALSNKYIDKQNTTVRQRLQGIRVIRAFNRENTEQERIERDTVIMAENIIKANTTMGALSPIASAVLNIVTLLIVYFGARKMQNPNSILSAGDIMAVLQYVALTMQALMSASYSIIMLPRTRISAKRVNEVLNLPDSIQSGLIEDLSVGSISLKDITFFYPDASKEALKNINLKVDEGEKVAIIGGTGSGKTTLLKLILGFFAPTSGELCYNGIDYTKVSPLAVRKSMSVSMQKAAIFSGSVRENLLMGNEGASDEELYSALEDAQIKGFVVSQKEGLDYALSQGGTNLSGGQKQRISIARCLLRKANIYAFDDSFSALDYLTEQKLRAALNQRIKGAAQLVITQRIASARGADRIYVLDKGELAGVGSHSELLKSSIIYREIYQSQTGEEPPVMLEVEKEQGQEQAEQAGQVEQVEQAEQAGQVEQAEQAEQAGQVEQAEQAGQAEQAEQEQAQNKPKSPTAPKED